jgi:hypothetical protein
LARKFSRRFFEFLAELIVVLGAAGEANHGDSGRELAFGGEIVEGRNEFAVGKVSGGAEDYDTARLRHSASRQAFA